MCGKNYVQLTLTNECSVERFELTVTRAFTLVFVKTLPSFSTCCKKLRIFKFQVRSTDVSYFEITRQINC